MIDGVQILDERMSVQRNGHEVILSPRQFSIFKMVANARHGIRPRAIFEIEYSNDPNGGPDYGHRVVHQYRCSINRRIAPLGLVINSAAKTWDGPYELQEVAP